MKRHVVMIVELANDIKERNEVGKNFLEKNENSIKFNIVEYKYNYYNVRTI